MPYVEDENGNKLTYSVNYENYNGHHIFIEKCYILMMMVTSILKTAIL